MLENHSDGVRVYLYVQPNGKKNEVLGEHDQKLKIRVQAPPVEGKANEAVEKFVALLFGVSANQVALIRGQQSRLKVVEIKNLNFLEAQKILANHLKTPR